MGIFSRKTKDEKSGAKEDAQVKDVKKTEDKKASMKDLYSESGKKDVASKNTKDKNVEKTSIYSYKVLVKPLVTEKASELGSENKYIFEVSKSANKIEIAKAIQGLYGIKPVKVNVIGIKGKNVRYGRMNGKRKDWKKAMITLPKGESIKIYEGV